MILNVKLNSIKYDLNVIQKRESAKADKKRVNVAFTVCAAENEIWNSCVVSIVFSTYRFRFSRGHNF